MPPIQIPARVTRVKQFTRFTQFPLSCSSRGDMVVLTIVVRVAGAMYCSP
jgi:hypothetical protein